MADASDPSYLARLGRDRLVVSFATGIALGSPADARGVLFKLLFANDAVERVLMPAGLLPLVIRYLEGFTADFRRDSRVNSGPDADHLRLRPPIDQSDFDRLRDEDIAVKAAAMAGRNALGLRLTFTDGAERGLFMHVALAFRLLDALRAAAPEVPPIPGVDVPEPPA